MFQMQCQYAELNGVVFQAGLHWNLHIPWHNIDQEREGNTTLELSASSSRAMQYIVVKEGTPAIIVQYNNGATVNPLRSTQIIRGDSLQFEL